jgi:hypothetical protein
VRTDGGVRLGWLRGMYIYTLVLAGGLGVGMLAAPRALAAALGLPSLEPIVFGIAGSVYVAFGIVSVFGLRAPVTFAPVLVMQLAYKSAWLAGVALPLVLRGQFPAYGVSFVVIFVTYIVGDLIAIPFPRILGRPGRD